MASSSARSTAFVVTLVAVSCAALGWATDAWYGRLLLERERSTVTVLAENSARALEQEVDRRIALLSGWRAFAESYNGNRERLDQDVPVFGTGLLAGLSGVRALQFVHEYRIEATWPLADNERALGLDLRTHPDSTVGRDVTRALQTRRLTITGPVKLVQGGNGLLVRLPTALPRGVYPELATIILDVDTMLADAGLISGDDTRGITVIDRSGSWVAGATTPLENPVRALVHLADGDWVLERAPPQGWGASSVRERSLLRIAMVLIALLLIGLAYVLAGRQARLTQAVHARTQELQAVNHDLAIEVDERRAAVATMRERAEQLRLALAAGRMGVWGWDLETGRVHCDDGVAELFGLTAERTPVTIDQYLAWLAPADRELLQERLVHTRETGEPLQIEHRIVSSSGAERSVYSSAELQTDPDGGRRRLLGVIMDVTARARLEEQLRQAQKMDAVGTLAGGIAHDFNNLLTAILGFARLAQESLSNQPPSESDLSSVNEDLSELIRAGDRAALLTAQLLAFSRQQVVQSIAVDMNSVVADLERMLSRLLDERIALKTSPSSDAVVVRGDPGQLSQVLLNLVVNARDAMPDGGEIIVSTCQLTVHADGPARSATEQALRDVGAKHGRWVELCVSDTGSGMSQDVQSRMFEPFYTTKPTGQGTGLGLSTVYGLVSGVGGHILVDSREGRGTIMRVLWPALEGTVEAVDQDTPQSASTRGGETVLVVEDEPGVRRLVSEILQRHGYKVLVAEHGGDAREQLEQRAAMVASAQSPATRVGESPPIDASAVALVISDVVMPHMGGLELVEIMRVAWPHVPMLLMSGYPASTMDISRVDVPILTKPFAPRDLLDQVRAAIDAASAHVPLPQLAPLA